MPEYRFSIKVPQYEELTILKEDGKLFGRIRIKPSSVLWKPVSAQRFHSVSIEKFVEWITSEESGSKKVRS